jgi:hypothetical protein
MKWAGVAVGFLLLVGCDTPSAVGARIGRNCEVQIRRDLLGTSSNLPVGVDTQNINGAAVALSGKLTEDSADYVVLTLPEPAMPPREYIVPRSSILFISCELPAKP